MSYREFERDRINARIIRNYLIDQEIRGDNSSFLFERCLPGIPGIFHPNHELNIRPIRPPTRINIRPIRPPTRVNFPVTFGQQTFFPDVSPRPHVPMPRSNQSETASRFSVPVNNTNSPKQNQPSAVKAIEILDETVGPHDNTVIMCPVCFGSVRSNNPMITRCGHAFCGNCIKTAVSMYKKCPVCNREVKMDEIIQMFI